MSEDIEPVSGHIICQFLYIRWINSYFTKFLSCTLSPSNGFTYNLAKITKECKHNQRQSMHYLSRIFFSKDAISLSMAFIWVSTCLTLITVNIKKNKKNSLGSTSNTCTFFVWNTIRYRLRFAKVENSHISWNKSNIVVTWFLCSVSRGINPFSLILLSIGSVW